MIIPLLRGKVLVLLMGMDAFVGTCMSHTRVSAATIKLLPKPNCSVRPLSASITERPA